MAFCFPIGVLIHECGHFVAGKLFGWETTFHAAFVGWTHSSTPPAWANMVFLLAAIVFDIFFVCTGLFLLARNAGTASRHRDSVYLLATLLASYSIRWTIAPVFVLLNLSDEAQISALLGLNRWVLPICTLPIGIGVTAAVVLSHIRSHTVTPLIAGAFGAFCGLGAWVNLVGPVLFGK